MTTKDARKLRPGYRVQWSPDGTLGTVTKASGAGVGILWEDGWSVHVRFWHEDSFWADVCGAGDVPRPDTRLTLTPDQRHPG